MSGFAKEPIKGDGYSRAKAITILKSNRRTSGKDPVAHAQWLASEDTKRWLGQVNAEDKPLTLDELLEDAPDRLAETKLEAKDMVMFSFYSGLWSVGLVPDKKVWDWQITAKVGNRWAVAPAVIRKRIVRDLGEDAYETWKERVLSDAQQSNLRVCMEAACDMLAKKEQIAMSYITSPSSQRLLERLGVRCEKGWTFLFPHYCGTF